ncbi:hypothetical protein [Actinophytocola oryzae]|uniref:hypothetical protein n=1 Tax=Actinophytocola oryzae TaxID=502181 RepID=UPI0010628D98|nr:hypothetical protein [Actinophytocola oryzae]
MSIDLGTVPAWISSLALPLALIIFIRDRGNTERSQVDLIGAWTSPRYEFRAPDDPSEDFMIEVDVSVRNSSQLPVELVQLGCKVATAWLVPDWQQIPTGQGPNIWGPTPGTTTSKFFVEKITLPPGDTRDISAKIDVRNHAPKDAKQLTFPHGIHASIEWILVHDNAGRRWELLPSKGRRAKRIRWYSRRKEYQDPAFRGVPPRWLPFGARILRQG